MLYLSFFLAIIALFFIGLNRLLMHRLRIYTERIPGTLIALIGNGIPFAISLLIFIGSPQGLSHELWYVPFVLIFFQIASILPVGVLTWEHFLEFCGVG